MTSLKSAEPAAPPKLRVPVWVIVAIACTTQFVLVMNTTIVTVALPGIHRALGLSITGQQWVINGFLVTYGGFLLLSARAGDLFGQKNVFQTGLVIFTLSSLTAGLAQDSGWLLAARFVMGLGAAAMTPSTISLIITTPMENHHRTRALGLWSAAASIGGAAGLVLGGVLTSALGWRYVLLLNVPVGVALLLASAVSLLPSVADSNWRRLDIPGAVTATLGVAALVYGLSDASTSGWGSARVIATLAAAIVLLVAFVAIETRTAAPLVPFSIFRHRPLSIANVLFATLGVTLTAVVYFLSLYEEQILGCSAIHTGLTLVPMTIVTAIGAIASQKMVPIFGPRMLLIVGGVLAAIGMAWLSRISVHSDYTAHVLGPLLIAGAGMSLMFVPIVAAATIGIDRQHAGLASGLVNMSRQVGGAIGLAILVTIAASDAAHHHGLSAAAGVVHGYRTVFVITAAVSLASVLIATLLPAKPKPVPAPPAPEPATN
ncbi:DHA2 family efflux MFS transporter permease subunit [Rudaeicoccus suwonensis]|uniref:EmrB/QacA subfamily drug resistance transporter n=1 Tax=Rudaeicoccus suwonensis TaxID=657409 RepID=A0A561E427_9MICO|nr:DHA2 family efflux MFS transporter permease subunit [Rudaeicoccus suwonensis]TWE10363.1 EmrB/QacA subfamily drug resistance transporter [Rudaeicoccus suwonensis]